MIRKIILPLDGMTKQEALDTITEMDEAIDWFKVGFEMIARQDAGAIAEVAGMKGKKIFWDMKLHDIPETVALTTKVIAQTMGVGMMNVHCSGSMKMMAAAREVIDPAWGVKLIGVTVLTSLDFYDLVEIGMIQDNPNRVTDAEWRDEQVQARVLSLARQAKDMGLDGVVTSPKETMAIRGLCGQDFTIVTPGVRLAGSDHHDQARVTTPGEAIRFGSDYLVIGRPITQPKSGTPLDAAKRINDEIAQALEEKR